MWKGLAGKMPNYKAQPIPHDVYSSCPKFVERFCQYIMVSLLVIFYDTNV